MTRSLVVVTAAEPPAPNPPEHSLPIRPAAFIAAFREVGTITQAAEIVGVTRQAHYYWLENRDGYREAFDDAELEVNDKLEALLTQRVLEGIEENDLRRGGEPHGGPSPARQRPVQDVAPGPHAREVRAR